jgi:predicted small lipoprotein YifL
MKRLHFIALLALFLFGCGQKGALVRPERPESAASPSAMATQTP